jgi:hypothetical protein
MKLLEYLNQLIVESSFTWFSESKWPLTTTTSSHCPINKRWMPCFLSLYRLPLSLYLLMMILLTMKKIWNKSDLRVEAFHPQQDAADLA